MIEVCTEEKLNEILARYLNYNSDAASYTWKYRGEPLDMAKTLGKTFLEIIIILVTNFYSEENAIKDEDLELEELGMNPEQWTPAIHLYFNEDYYIYA